MGPPMISYGFDAIAHPTMIYTVALNKCLHTEQTTAFAIVQALSKCCLAEHLTQRGTPEFLRGRGDKHQLLVLSLTLQPRGSLCGLNCNFLGSLFTRQRQLHRDIPTVC